MKIRFLKFAVLLTILMTQPVQADVQTLVGKWTFDGTDKTPDLRPVGNVKLDVPGPRAPEFPDFPQTNTAARLDGNGAAFQVIGSGTNSDFQFNNGDSITLTAWVKMTELPSGEQAYVIGKGRSERPEFVYGNQNWSLRLARVGRKICLDFLFCTRKDGADKSQWHKWRSKATFEPDGVWHFVAVTYRFGDPDSMKGWIDSQPTLGEWSLAGPTQDPPVVDHDDVWIGTSMKRNAGVSFKGVIDEVAVHRVRVDDEILEREYKRVMGVGASAPKKPEMPQLGDIPPGVVRYSLAEGFARHDRWLLQDEDWPAVTTTWDAEEFLLPRLPYRYDSFGIRSSWKSPVLMRVAADVPLPAGEVQFLMRARGLSRLWVNHQLVVETKPDTVRYVNGRNPIHPPPKPPLPGHRPMVGNMQEVTGKARIEGTTDDGKVLCRVVAEVVVGGERVRTDPGEFLVAVLSEDQSRYDLLTANRELTVPLTNAAVLPVLARVEQRLTAHDDLTRRQAAAAQKDFWKKRHQLAQDWVAAHSAPVPNGDSSSGEHPIDRFIAAKISRARELASSTSDEKRDHFYQTVLPILQENCFRCHGEKERGGLRLNTREGILSAGESEIPAVIPGDPDGSELIVRIREKDESLRMPPTGDGLTDEQVRILEEWVRSGAEWPAAKVSEEQLAQPPLVGDAEFLRRVYLDTVGVPPTAAEAAEFIADSSSGKREKLIDRLLADPRVADQWVSYWQDVLAENPTLISASLNSTGPFRWYIYESLRDNKPMDRFVTELILMRGSVHEGGSAGFSVAGENDSPFAAKGQILASAFLGIELQCARCHDSPYHSTLQSDLYSLAAMLNRNAVTVPSSSRVPAAFFEKKDRESLIKVSLKPDQPIPPKWPFADVTGVADGKAIDALMMNPKDTRERLAALITSPENRLFARVLVNRVWKQLMGAGIVEPVDDWEGRQASHPEMLDWLANDFMAHDYDFRHLMRQIMTSQAYQRRATGQNLVANAETRFFNAPDRRRMSAEQVVDSLYVATGNVMDCEPLSFDPDGRDSAGYRLNLGRPSRAWMMADLKNERDRPSLSLPDARIIVDVLESFGWTGARQMPRSQREMDPNVLQPGILSNGVLTMNLTRASLNSSLAQLAATTQSAEELVETLFLQILTRRPTEEERATYLAVLSPGFPERLLPPELVTFPEEPEPLPKITWFNHANEEANDIQLEKEIRIRRGPPADPRLNPDWRIRFEDAVWSLINDRDFVWIP